MQKNAGAVVADKMGVKNTLEKIRHNHWLMMILCCLIPLIISGILFYFGFRKYAILAVMLLCPVLHYFLMKDMHKNKDLNKEKRCH